MPKKTKEPSEWFETELKPELETICRIYKNTPPEKRVKFLEIYNRIVEEMSDSDDVVKNAMFEFRDNLIKFYGGIQTEAQR